MIVESRAGIEVMIPECYYPLTDELTDDELKNVRQELVDGKDLNKILSEHHNDKNINVIRTTDSFRNDQYYLQAFFRYYQAREIKKLKHRIDDYIELSGKVNLIRGTIMMLNNGKFIDTEYGPLKGDDINQVYLSLSLNLDKYK